MSFIDDVKKVKQKRNHKIKNSYGLQDVYKYYRKNKSIKQKISTQSLYSSIIKDINECLIKSFLHGNEIKFPKRIGSLYIVKNSTKIYTKDGKLRNTYPIDWKQTLELWESDQEAFNNRFLVKTITKEVFKVKYDKSKSNYINKSFFDFKVNRSLKLRLKEQIKDNNINAYIKKTYE